MEEQEGASTRRVLKQAAVVLDRELNVLYMDKRDRDDVIASQQKQIKLMRESVEYADDLKMQALHRADLSLIAMWLAFVVAGAAIGYAVWVG